MKRYFLIFIMWLLLLTGILLPGCTPAVPVSLTPVPTEISTPTPTPFTDRYIEAFEVYESTAGICAVYDINEDVYLYTKQDLSTRIFPASTTKLFTAWVALQYLRPEEMVTVGNELERVAPDASVANLERGDILSVAMLIEGMLLPSGNDAAYVVACRAGRTIAGNDDLDVNTAISTFMEEVNRQADLKGLSGTHFVSPDGYHHPDHYTTVTDMMQIATLAIANPIIAQYTQTPSELAVFSNGKEVLWKNTNLLLHQDSPYYLPAAVGLKTGYTKEAGYVLLSAVRNPHTSSLVLILVAQCPTPESRFAETVSLYNVLKSVEIA